MLPNDGVIICQNGIKRSTFRGWQMAASFMLVLLLVVACVPKNDVEVLSGGTAGNDSTMPLIDSKPIVIQGFPFHVTLEDRRVTVKDDGDRDRATLESDYKIRSCITISGAKVDSIDTKEIDRKGYVTHLEISDSEIGSLNLDDEVVFVSLNNVVLGNLLPAPNLSQVLVSGSVIENYDFLKNGGGIKYISIWEPKTNYIVDSFVDSVREMSATTVSLGITPSMEQDIGRLVFKESVQTISLIGEFKNYHHLINVSTGDKVPENTGFQVPLLT